MIIYTDGSFDNVYKIGAFGIFYGVDDLRNRGAVLSEPAESSSYVEAVAVLEVLKSQFHYIKPNGDRRVKVTIYTDSLSVVRFINNGVHTICGLLIRDPKLTVNAVFEDLINFPTQYHQTLIKCMRKIFDLGTLLYNIKAEDIYLSRIINLKHVKGHAGYYGNEMADRFAYSSMKEARHLYHKVNHLVPEGFDVGTLSYQNVLDLLCGKLRMLAHPQYKSTTTSPSDNVIAIEDDNDIFCIKYPVPQKSMKPKRESPEPELGIGVMYIDLAEKDITGESNFVVISDNENEVIEPITPKATHNLYSDKDEIDLISHRLKFGKYF